MSQRRRQPCNRVDARTKHRHAVAYLETANLVVTEGTLPADYDFNHVAAGVAVLAAISAGDALCCALLGERSREQDHRHATDLLATIRFGDGPPAARAKRACDLAAALATALDLKDESHYGTSLLGASEVRRLIRAATKLTSAAGAVLDGSP